MIIGYTDPRNCKLLRTNSETDLCNTMHRIPFHHKTMKVSYLISQSTQINNGYDSLNSLISQNLLITIKSEILDSLDTVEHIPMNRIYLIYRKLVSISTILM